ncbi:unnamed protein product [Brassica rapa]|uniref:MATH domain-containing protein n=1 Tax=Brassica campestris TaxID=3711 RepID=A0A8D9HTX5_BRACM|nr:unnamed protein product [Brassica rapa]
MQWFYPMTMDLAYTSVVLLPKFLDKDSGFLVNDQVKIVVEVDALQDIPVETEKTEENDCVLLKEGSSIMESIDVNGFHVFPSQVRFLLMVGLVRSACMNAGFKVDWLEKNLEQVKEKKLKELSGLAMLQETEEKTLRLKRKFEELDALAEEQKKELSATRTSLTFDDVV